MRSLWLRMSQPLVCVLGRTRGFDSPAYRNAPTMHDRIVIWHHAQPSTDRRRGWVRGFLNNRGANNEIYILECERAAGLYEKRLFGLLSGAAAGFSMSAGDQDGTGTGGCPPWGGSPGILELRGEERVLRHRRVYLPYPHLCGLRYGQGPPRPRGAAHYTRV